eukprot:5053252-Prymnesium_polylepis.1
MVVFFFYGYVTAGPFLSAIDAALAVAVQSWCLDYKQNCQELEGEHWMLAVHDAPGLEAVHAVLLEELVRRETTRARESSTRKAGAKAGGKAVVQSPTQDALRDAEEGRGVDVSPTGKDSVHVVVKVSRLTLHEKGLKLPGKGKEK